MTTAPRRMGGKKSLSSANVATESPTMKAPSAARIAIRGFIVKHGRMKLGAASEPVFGYRANQGVSLRKDRKLIAMVIRLQSYHGLPKLQYVLAYQ